MRVPSFIVICIAALFFLLYLLPWRQLPNPKTIATPLAASIFYNNNNANNNNVIQQQLEKNLSLQIVSNVPGLVSFSDIQNSSNRFNASSSDVMVILHIQKTGGTSFEKHIVQDLSIDQPCSCWVRRKRCKCPRPGGDVKKNFDPWLFSRFSTGWACGLHADWTELTSGCVEGELDRKSSSIKRRYFYVTMVRDPIHRFLSEFRHVQRGATWKASRHFCNGRYATLDELGKCYSGHNWTGVSLEEFLSCKHNLAFNRQTRMMADLSLVGCYNRSYMPLEERNRILLASAKNNLDKMAFFGLTEYQKISQYLFEVTFGVKFKVPFIQNEATYSKTTFDESTKSQLELIRKVNNLDLELYSFAEQLQNKRFEELKKADRNFEDHYNYIGEEKGNKFSWNDVDYEE